MAILNIQIFIFRLMFFFFQRHHHILLKTARILLPLESLLVDVTTIDAEIKESKNLNSSTCSASSPLKTNLIHVPSVDMSLNSSTFIHNPISCFAFSSDFFLKTVSSTYVAILNFFTQHRILTLPNFSPLFNLLACWIIRFMV